MRTLRLMLETVPADVWPRDLAEAIAEEIDAIVETLRRAADDVSCGLPCEGLSQEAVSFVTLADMHALSMEVVPLADGRLGLLLRDG